MTMDDGDNEGEGEQGGGGDELTRLANSLSPPQDGDKGAMEIRWVRGNDTNVFRFTVVFVSSLCSTPTFTARRRKI